MKTLQDINFLSQIFDFKQIDKFINTLGVIDVDTINHSKYIEDFYKSVIDKKILIKQTIEELQTNDLENIYNNLQERQKIILNERLKVLKNLGEGVFTNHFLMNSTMDSINKSLNTITLMIFYELQKRENIKNRATIMMKSSPVKDWKDYEQRVYKKFKLEYPNIDIFYNVETLGKSSKTLRQVDTLVNSTVAGINVRIAIECKAYSRKIDVDKIESFANRLKQIGANHGVVITNERELGI
ncbi:restriction endonuclease [Bernardetia sp. OM2101]|uniref:restriction endonuclease n=1 Tax=Bernardetia sp. OM2101 TaxID=3344876 RepID=UPI0035CEC424